MQIMYAQTLDVIDAIYGNFICSSAEYFNAGVTKRKQNYYQKI